MSRGRIVMLVDNEVRNDSRVQKQARSIAEHGWDVTLIGRSPTKKVQRFKLGQAKVRLIPVGKDLTGRRYQLDAALRPGRLRYPSKRAARFRAREVEAKAYDARIRRATWEQEHSEGRRTTASLMLGKVRTKVALARNRVESRWVALRSNSGPQSGPRKRQESATGEKWGQLVAKRMGDRAWRVLDPHLWDFEFAFADAIDRLKPDIIHANDFAMIGVGARATIRARRRGRDVRLVYDAHEYVPGMNAAQRHPWWLPAMIAYEREYIGFADAVVTVSAPLAEMLQREHHLPEKPAVVLNAPVVGETNPDPGRPRMRELCGIDASTPLLVYSGSMTAQRGVGIMVEALPRLPDAHVAFVVSSPDRPFIQELMTRAKELGVDDRVHLLPYVAPEHVVEYVADADVGVHPTHHFVNHEISLATKFFEYAHARLPIVVSDVKTMADMVNASGQGEVFRAEDLDDYIRAVNAVLADPEKYRSAYERAHLLEEWTWDKQAEILAGVYERLIGGRTAVATTQSVP